MTMHSYPSAKIAIIIPVHNRREITLACLGRLNFVKRHGFHFNVIVVDDGSTDGTGKAIEIKYPNVVILHGNGNLWWTGAINKGVIYAIDNGYDYVLTLNDDIDFEEDFLIELHETSKKFPDSIVSSISVLDSNKDIIVSSGYLVSGKLRHFASAIDNKKASNFSNEVVFCDMLSGRSLLMPIKVFKKIGIFDERRFPHCFADLEFTHRAKLNGFTLVANTKSKIYTELNSNNFSVYLVKSRRQDFLKGMFNVKYGYSLNTIFFLAFMHKPFYIGVADCFYQFLKLAKWLLIKTFMPKSFLMRCISRRIDTALYAPYIAQNES